MNLNPSSGKPPPTSSSTRCAAARKPLQRIRPDRRLDRRTRSNQILPGRPGKQGDSQAPPLGPTPSPQFARYQNKELTKFAFHKYLILKGMFVAKAKPGTRRTARSKRKAGACSR